MEETPTGGTPPEAAKPPEKADTEATEQVMAEETKTDIPPVPPAPPVEPYYNRPVNKKDWMLFALIAVSVIAVLLLAATISLAVVDCNGHGFRYGNQMGNRRFFGNGNQGTPRFRYTPRTQGQQGQSQVPQTTPTTPQQAPAPGQSP